VARMLRQVGTTRYHQHSNVSGKWSAKYNIYKFIAQRIVKTNSASQAFGITVINSNSFWSCQQNRKKLTKHRWDWSPAQPPRDFEDLGAKSACDQSITLFAVASLVKIYWIRSFMYLINKSTCLCCCFMLFHGWSELPSWTSILVKKSMAEPSL
jgi:hypothetical protein